MNIEGQAALATISQIERETGIAKETLRVWERRYGFPDPGRDANGERVYTPEQLNRLKNIKRLLDQGYRPGKLMGLSEPELADLSSRGDAAAAAPDRHPLIDDCIALVGAHRVDELRRTLSQSELRMGVRAFVTGLVAPLINQVGREWVTGRLAIFEEHLFAEVLEDVMRSTILKASVHLPENAAPRIVLTTTPVERHGLGLLMAQAIFALEGAYCVSLGTRTPLSDIVAAAGAHRADVVALSFSSATSPRAAFDNIAQLTERLSGLAEVWAGGECAAKLVRRLGPDRLLDLDGIPGAVQRWRAARLAS